MYGLFKLLFVLVSTTISSLYLYLLWVKLCPQKDMLKVLNPGICGLILK